MENKPISSDLIRGHIDTIILHTLLEGDKFPQQISDCIIKKSDNKYEINQATLYSSLKRLETLKYVEAYWHDTIGGRRKYYKLTTDGKNAVESNLSNWSYSRAIIDKLMDVEPEPVVVTKTVFVAKPVEQLASQTPDTPQAIPTVAKTPTENKPTENTEPNSVKVSETISYYKSETEQEKNFRNILNGLIKATKRETEQSKKDFKSTINVDETAKSAPKSEEIQPFSRTIDKETKFSIKDTGKIDFGELALSVAQDGYKLKVSSKGPRIAKGSLYQNKINLYSSLCVFVLALLEFLIIGLTCKTFINFGFVEIFFPLVAICALPLIFYYLYKKAPYKTIKKVKIDELLTALIIVFNLILITFAIDLLANLNFADSKSLFLAFLMPITLYLDGLSFVGFRYLIARSEFLNVKKAE